MSRSKRCLSLLCFGLLAAGCRGNGSDPVPAGLPGTYVYAAKGSTLKKPWEFSAQIELRPDRSYVFTLDKTVEGEKDSTETNVGTYFVSGDQVQLREADALADGSRDIHHLKIKADSLIAVVGWTAELFLKGVGAPNIVFVKQRRG
ncbi:MAG: hypothetical protein ABR585_01245 [Gemmatimonadaceae bacterium]